MRVWGRGIVMWVAAGAAVVGVVVMVLVLVVLVVDIGGWG